MTTPTSSWRTGTPYDAFLFASVGTDANGVEISALSAFARMEIDPWVEAATLAHLAVAPATERLAALISSLPDGPTDQGDFRAIAGRLIALLPSRTAIKSRAAASNRAAEPAPMTKTYSRALVIIVLVALALGGQWFVKAMDQSAGPTDGAPGFAFDIAPKPSPFTTKP